MNGTWTTLDIAGKPADVCELAAGRRPRFDLLHLRGISLVAFTRLIDEG